MSVRVMALVWAMDLPDSDKIVLLALADCANDEGHCWPSMKSLVAKCSKTDRTIQFAIKRLCEDGHLTRREVPGKGCNYTVHPRKDIAPEAASPPKPATPTPEAASDKPSRTINTGTKVPFERVQESYNSVAKQNGFRVSKVLDASLKQIIRHRHREHGLDGLAAIFELAGKASWLRDKAAADGWKPDLEFMLRPATIRKLREGGYGQDDDGSSAKWTPERRAEYAARLAGDAQGIGPVALKVVGGLRQ